MIIKGHMVRWFAQNGDSGGNFFVDWTKAKKYAKDKRSVGHIVVENDATAQPNAAAELLGKDD